VSLVWFTRCGERVRLLDDGLGNVLTKVRRASAGRDLDVKTMADRTSSLFFAEFLSNARPECRVRPRCNRLDCPPNHIHQSCTHQASKSLNMSLLAAFANPRSQILFPPCSTIWSSTNVGIF